MREDAVDKVRVDQVGLNRHVKYACILHVISIPLTNPLSIRASLTLAQVSPEV